MAQKVDADHVAKDRIIKHMNNDHHDSIIRYLQHYGKIPSWKAYDGRLVDISLDILELSCHGHKIKVPISPPMENFRQARERVVLFDKECRQALGVSDVTVKQYLPPTGSYAFSFLVILSTMLAYSQRSWFAQGQQVEHVLGSTFARLSFVIQPYLLSGLILVHGLETLYFAHAKLAKHSVNVKTWTWWLWLTSVFIEGQFAYKRFNGHVQRQREKQKH